LGDMDFVSRKKAAELLAQRADAELEMTGTCMTTWGRALGDAVPSQGRLPDGK